MAAPDLVVRLVLQRGPFGVGLRNTRVTVLQEIELGLDVEGFLEAQGEAFRRSGVREAARWGLDEAARLIRPAMSYEWFAVECVDERRVQLAGGFLTIGRHADLMAAAREAFLGVVTIGPQLEEKARELGAAGRTLESYVLGEAGVFAVGSLIQKARRLVEEEAAGRSWGVGTELAPGQLAGWDIEEQALVCGLLDVASIGVTVTGTGMLVPQKSASILVGVGPQYTSAEVRTPCEFCDVRDTCRWRH